MTEKTREFTVNLPGLLAWFFEHVRAHSWSEKKSLQNLLNVFPGMEKDVKICESTRLVISRVYNHKISVEHGVKEFADMLPRKMRLKIDRRE